MLYETGVVVQIGIVKARKFFELTGLKEEQAEIRNLALLYERGLVVPQEQQKAREFYEKAATLNDYYAIQKLGISKH